MRALLQEIGVMAGRPLPAVHGLAREFLGQHGFRMAKGTPDVLRDEAPLVSLDGDAFGGIPAVRGVSHFLVLGEINGIGGRGRLQGGVLFKLRNVLRRAVGVGFGKNRGSHRARVERHFLGARRWRGASQQDKSEKIVSAAVRHNRPSRNRDLTKESVRRVRGRNRWAFLWQALHYPGPPIFCDGASRSAASPI